jgi:hypothetical protein
MEEFTGTLARAVRARTSVRPAPCGNLGGFNEIVL